MMTRRTYNLIGAIFCTATALLLSLMAITGIGIGHEGDLSQDVSYETVDHRG